ncbi:MAG: cytochrome-c oxidase, cbb3-type subunit II [Gammaproteobacteria bacterium]|nr:cytochrome-c oxidase, cbb3-type subunit II [Gammaproteobacteria bacterium]
MKAHDYIERRVGVLSVLILLVISFGGLAEIVPLFHMQKTTTPVEGMTPWTALELEGRDIYIREGCHVCHTQMVRPFRAETERYGHYSVAGESVWERPFLWGSKRTGPDLARLAGKYSDDWHRVHLYNPRDVVPESNMPAFPWLFQQTLDGRDTARKMQLMQSMGVPYTDEQIASARQDVRGRTEIDALVAYLQGLGRVMQDR